MKKLLSCICCVLYLHSFSQAPIESIRNTPRADGQKLIKALAVIVNPENNKKAPAKTVQLYAAECP